MTTLKRVSCPDSVATAIADGVFSPLLYGLISLFVVSCLDIPICAYFEAWAAASGSGKTDHHFNMQAFAGILGYVVMGGACSCLDVAASIFGKAASWKVQGTKSLFTPWEWFEAVGVSVANLLVFSWFATLPAFHLRRWLWGEGLPGMSTEAVRFMPTILRFAIHGAVIEIWFYLTHRALHSPRLFKAVHKRHHRFHAPCAVACMYAHPFEYVVGNTMGVVLGPVLTNAPATEAAFWLCFCLVSTCGSHCGYAFLGARDHDEHHEHFDVNFGVGLFMDRLCGTGFEGSALEEKVKARKARESSKVCIETNRITSADNSKEMAFSRKDQ